MGLYPNFRIGISKRENSQVFFISFSFILIVPRISRKRLFPVACHYRVNYKAEIFFPMIMIIVKKITKLFIYLYNYLCYRKTTYF